MGPIYETICNEGIETLLKPIEPLERDLLKMRWKRE